MSFPPYAEYKDSGVACLGAVPGHWEVKPFRYGIDFIESGTSVNALDTPATDNEPAVLKTSCVYTGDFRPDENKIVVPDEIFRLSCPVKSGTLIVSRMNTPELVGAAGLVRESVPNLYLPDRLWQLHLKGLVASFAHYWTQSPSYRGQVEVACAGTSASMQNLSQGQLCSFALAFPPLAEQKAIAGFLDREVGKIDGLVAEQERLIALLKEKRQAVISHAVTKGLDPNAPLKDSGIAWLGPIPAHWEVKRLRHIATLNPSKSEVTELDSETEVSFLPMEAIGEDGSLALERTRAIADVSTGYTYFREGDVTIAKITPCFENGKGAVMRGLVHGVGFGTTELIVLRPQENMTTSAYLDWVFRTRPFRALGEGAMYGAGGQKRVPDDFVRDFAIGIPPMGEQAQIIARLDQISASFDALSSQAQSAITLLAERRAALISAAVTGKIDVRAVVALPSAARETA